jgi:3-methyladenine DNA glycosylase/8-oxoguanine DNA glycosylase
MALLRLPEPYDFELSTGRYRAFGPDLANAWHEGALYRVVDGREVRIAAARGGLEVDPLDDEITVVVRLLLGAPFELAAFYRFSALDPVLGPLAERLRGLRPPLAPTPFESLVTSITAQQVSLFAAFAIRNRLIRRFGASAGEHAVAFPTRDALAAADEDELLGLGFSRRKAAYVIGLARSDLDLDELAALPDDEVKAQLTALPGIGEWTADWFLARHLARPHAWPAGDLGLRKAVPAFYGDNGRLSTEEVRAIGDRFDPFQNLTAHYLLTGYQTGLWK